MASFAELTKTAIPSDTTATLYSIATAREHFIGTGEFIDKRPRSVIASSWQRCRQLGINPHEERARSVLLPEEIEARLHNDNLGLAGKTVLDRMAQTVAGTRHVIVMADSSGRILYSVGHRQIQSHLEKINFRPGSEWAEDVVGPNGIGTPLAIGRPELVLGSEHYCQGWQPWVCYGSPIQNPGDQSILGCIDITGPAENIQAEAMALAVSIAHSVESSLSIIQLQRREILRNSYIDMQMRWPNDALLVIDEIGYIVDVNSHASDLLNLSAPLRQNIPFSQLFPDLWISVKACLRDGTEKGCEIRLQNSTMNFALCNIKPVKHKGERLGCTINFPSGKQTNGQSKNNVKQYKKHINTADYTFEHILGNSPAFREVMRMARIASQDALNNSVLLIGETGAGKELIAHAIHAEGLRLAGPFIAINCGALPRDLIESELFGYVPGTFTGGRREGSVGKFESADNGTLFLDEIDSLDLDLQVKFLRVLDDMKVTRLGSVNPVSIDVRIIAASSTKLLQEVKEGRFRLDLFHRLNVIEIQIPSLRERGEDILDLLEYFLAEACACSNREKLILSSQIRDYLMNYHWPGNIRELRNLSARWILTVDGNEIALHDLPTHLRFPDVCPDQTKGVSSDLRSIEDDLIKRTLDMTGGNISKTARILCIDRSTIYRRRKHWQQTS
ncbi:MAG: sigma-54-dependent Fis family transcriptional regulator [Gammaproteobacteria bacterium]